LPSQVELEEVQPVTDSSRAQVTSIAAEAAADALLPDRYRWLEESSIEVTVDIPKLSEYRHSHLFALLVHAYRTSELKMHEDEADRIGQQTSATLRCWGNTSFRRNGKNRIRRGTERQLQ